MRSCKSTIRDTLEVEESRAARFLMYEALSRPEMKMPVEADDQFLANFHRTYSRMPPLYKGKPPDQATEAIKISVIVKLCDELKSLTQKLKAKLTT